MKYLLMIALSFLSCEKNSLENGDEKKEGGNLPSDGKLVLKPLPDKGYYYGKLGYKTSIHKIAVLPNKNLALIGETSGTEKSGSSEGFYSIIIPGEDSSIVLLQSKGGYFDLVVHPSGEYTLGKFEVLDSTSFKLVLERYSGNGKLVNKSDFVDQLLEPYYSISSKA